MQRGSSPVTRCGEPNCHAIVQRAVESVRVVLHEIVEMLVLVDVVGLISVKQLFEAVEMPVPARRELRVRRLREEVVKCQCCSASAVGCKFKPNVPRIIASAPAILKKLRFIPREYPAEGRVCVVAVKAHSATDPGLKVSRKCPATHAIVSGDGRPDIIECRRLIPDKSEERGTVASVNSSGRSTSGTVVLGFRMIGPVNPFAEVGHGR